MNDLTAESAEDAEEDELNGENLRALCALRGETISTPEAEPIWSVYLLLCDGREIYTGITTDVGRRLRQHRGELAGGARFMRRVQVVELIYTTAVGNRSLTSQVEHRLRRLSHAQKRAIAQQNPSPSELLTHLGLS
jgi:putative endonuclease